MRILVVDDEALIAEGEAGMIRRCAPQAEVVAFTDPHKALEALRETPAEVAFLDFEMPKCHGVMLAKMMKEICPLLNIVFATAYQEYYAHAMKLRASGYLLKPIQEEQIREELDNLRYPLQTRREGLFARTFGNFELFYNGVPVTFRYLKTKELFAYLIDRRGAVVTRDELITALWGGEVRHDNYYKQLLKDLHDTLEAIGKEDVIIRQRGAVGLLGNRIACDYYDWIHGLPWGLNAYRGEYMRQYPWAEPTRVSIAGGLALWEE